MSRVLLDLSKDIQTAKTLTQLTSAFEGLASMQISRVKSTVMQSKAFFDNLWQIYSEIRVDSIFNYGRRLSGHQPNDKELYVLITSEGSLSGEIDYRLIEWMLKSYDPAKQDIIVIGFHGATQLAQQGIKYKRYFKLPKSDHGINAAPIINEVQKYRRTFVYYQSYISLLIQDIKRISLSAMVEERGSKLDAGKDLITEETHIFEPSTDAVVDHLENSMLQLTLGQVILESKLAQYASRFRAMSAAHKKSEEIRDDKTYLFNRTKRAIKDERLRETVKGLASTRST